MANEKAPQIVIKKITVVSGGAHGGAWKVAFADFMTAMMAFFLVMWLIATSSEAEKKAVSDYFSTPSVIEYQFQNFGVELTLEKLFLDLINEPLKTLQGFITPMDKKPNLLNFGLKKVVLAYMAEQLGQMASNVQVNADSVVFEIPDNLLFEHGTANPAPEFVNVMERVKGVTGGLEDSNVEITSVVYRQSVPMGEMTRAKNVSEQRLDIVSDKVKSSLQSSSVEIIGHANAKNDERGARANQAEGGFVRFEVKQKKVLPDGKKPKLLNDTVFGSADANKNVYDNFVDQVAKRKSHDGQSADGEARSRRHVQAAPHQESSVPASAPAEENHN